jgi:hypothetical protein
MFHRDVARSRLENVPSGMWPGRDWKAFYWNVARLQVAAALWVAPGLTGTRFLRNSGKGRTTAGTSSSLRVERMSGDDWQEFFLRVERMSGDDWQEFFPSG